MGRIFRWRKQGQRRGNGTGGRWAVGFGGVELELGFLGVHDYAPCPGEGQAIFSSHIRL